MMWLTYKQHHYKICLMPYANNKGADQLVYPRGLVSAFVVHCSDRFIHIDAMPKISRL